MPAHSPSHAFYSRAVDALRQAGVRFAPGLSHAEIEQIETTYEFHFPPDLAEFLQLGVPLGEGFPPWRGRKAEVDFLLAWPADGLCFDVEKNHMWLDSWGPRPGALAEALQVVRNLVAQAPKLAPVYRHRYIPDEPRVAENPVLSVYQSDVIVYAENLSSYLALEFSVPPSISPISDRRAIRFWDEVVERNARRDNGA
jgi:hypothetical protein